MNISVNCPSYRRPKVETLDYLPFCQVWVDESEADIYRANNPGAQIISCKQGIQGNLCRIRNHILKTEFAAGADVVLIIDDDMQGVYRFEPQGDFGYAEIKVESTEFLDFIERYSSLAQEFGAKFWGVNINVDPQSYRHYTPFSTVSYIGGPFQCFLRGNQCYYDERLPLKEDYDMTLQQLNRERVVLRVNKYHYRVKQAKQAGGCAAYRNYEREKQQLEALQKKWGSDIVRCDFSDRSHKGTRKKVRMDFNPVIHPPIRGV